MKVCPTCGFADQAGAFCVMCGGTLADGGAPGPDSGAISVSAQPPGVPGVPPPDPADVTMVAPQAPPPMPPDSPGVTTAAPPAPPPLPPPAPAATRPPPLPPGLAGLTMAAPAAPQPAQPPRTPLPGPAGVTMVAPQAPPPIAPAPAPAAFPPFDPSAATMARPLPGLTGGAPPPPPPGVLYPTASFGPPPQAKPKRTALVVAACAGALVLAAGAALAVPAVREALFGGGDSAAQEPGGGAAGAPAGTELAVNNPLDLGAVFANAGAGTPPTGLPACPDGMSAVSWAEWADGIVLICGADGQGYAVEATFQGAEARARTLTFTADGWEVDFADGSRVVSSLDGGVVEAAGDAGTGAYLATAAWSAATGEAPAPPAGLPPLPSCPEGTWPISYSAWDTGWLLVCGAGADAPGAAYYAEGGGSPVQVDGNSFYGDGYCGESGAVGQVCSYSSPAVVALGERQVSASVNYFAGAGFGGAGQGTGAYDVVAPQDTAEDQVRYLVEILEKSAAGRAQLQPAIDAVGACRDVSGQVAVLEGVAQNRRDLLAALDSTPVDKVPDGPALVGLLRAALQASLGADDSYVAWAQAQLAADCASGAGRSYFDGAVPYNERAQRNKVAFTEQWNGQIAPAFGVRTFTNLEI